MAMESPRPKTHAASLEEKSGIDAPCSAASLGSDAVQINAANAPIARTLLHELKAGISVLPGAIRKVFVTATGPVVDYPSTVATPSSRVKWVLPRWRSFQAPQLSSDRNVPSR